MKKYPGSIETCIDFAKEMHYADAPYAKVEIEELRQQIDSDGKEISYAHNLLSQIGIGEGNLPKRIQELITKTNWFEPRPPTIQEATK
jgi:hypothetical protein